ncbi:organic cation transporter protein-like [Ostrinia furnacalis]|uniref:organic cation transporter protein-like n=1 Tax=Ostrinia furnacalis TaxID=93504 RepID=UPI00103A6C47|nr:organic cation transporter protein-like [Ostrinia furnacalis]
MVQTIQRIISQNFAQSKPTGKEDTLSQLIGHFGKWQFIIFAAVFLVKLSSGWVQMAILFLTPNLTFRCAEFKNSSALLFSRDIPILESNSRNNASSLNFSSVFRNGTFEENKCYSECMKYEYDTGIFDNTIVSEWDLVCERRWLASFTQMVLQLGILIGSILFGFLSDRYGRKNTFLLSITTLIAFGFVVPFSPNYTVFTVSRFFLGLATAGTMVISFVIIMETVGPRYRELLGCLFQIPFIIGHMTVPLFAYYFRSWDTYTLALAVPPLIYLGYFFVLNESPRWLVSVGRVEEATEIVTRAAEINNRSTTKIKETLTEFSQAIQSRSDEPKPNYTELFRRSLWLKTSCCCGIWLITGVTFFGLNQYISQTSPDPFISVSAAGAIQIPSILLSIWLIKTFGRKATTIAFSCFGGLCIITLGCLPPTFVIRLTLGTLGVSCASIVATTIYIFTSEIYPTVVRNMGMGAASTAMRIGSMIAPFISNVTTVPWLPTIVFGAAPIIAGALCLLLPETKGRVLPDSIDDVDEK